MAAQDLEKSDIVVVIDEDKSGNLDEMVSHLKAAGVEVDSIDNDNGVVEGTVDTAKVKSLEKLPYVKYVRDVFNYTSETGDDSQDESIPR